MAFELSAAGVPERYVFKAGERRGEGYRLGLRICRNPVCHCTNLVLEFVPTRSEEAAIREVTCDVFRERVLWEEDSGDRDLSQALEMDFSAGDWNLLRRLFHGAKKALLAGVDFSEVFGALFNEEEIEDGCMVSYDEIVPFDVRVELELGAHPVYVDDFYCLGSGAHCRGVHLMAYPLAHDSFWKIDLAEAPSLQIFLDLLSGKWHIEEEDEGLEIDPRKLMQVLRRQCNPVVAFYRRRRATLRTLYRNFLGGVDLTESLPEETVGKVGRNDPCPCGSGKKFKKCCLRKTADQADPSIPFWSGRSNLPRPVRGR